MKKSLRQKYINVTPPGPLIDNASATTAEVDTVNWDYMQYVVIMGATDIGVTALAVTESDATGSGHANVTGLVWGTATDIDGSTSVLPSATDDNGIFVANIDLRYRKRFLDLTLTVGDGAAGGYYTVLAILSRADESPSTVAGMGATGVLEL